MNTRQRSTCAVVVRSMVLAGLYAVGIGLPTPATSGSTSCPTCTSAQRCIVDGILNRALGAASISGTLGCHLLVSGIGSSGLDGFAQDSLPANTQQIRTTFTGPNLGESELGARQVVTCLANVPGGVLGTIAVEDVGDSTIEILPDFSAVGATLYTVTVMEGSTVTGVFTDLANPTVQTGDCVEVEIS